MGASPRPLPGEDPIRRRRADASDKPSIFLSVDGGEPTEPRLPERAGAAAGNSVAGSQMASIGRAMLALPSRSPEPPMVKITIAVLRIQGGWRVMKDDRQVGQYDYRVDAEDAGFVLTQRLHRSGRDVELLVQQDGSHEVKPLRGWETVH